MNFEQWKPRWYYIKRNKTSGKLYFGQTTNEVSSYLGSGKYWKSHCQKNGGFQKHNIENLFAEWFESETKAQEFVDFMGDWCPEYSKGGSGKKWANLLPENTGDSPWLGAGDSMKLLWTDERKELFSNTLKGNQRAKGSKRSQKTRQRIREANQGAKRSDERCRNIALGKLGKKIFNNGQKAKYFVPGEEPQGFVLGRLPK